MKIRAVYSKTFKVLIGIIFLAVCVLIILSGNIIESKLVKNERTNVQNGLDAIGKLKSNQIAHWFNERKASAEYIHRSQHFSEAINKYLLSKDAYIGQTIIAHLREIIRSHDYLSMFIVDTSGNIILAPSGNDDVKEHELIEIKKTELTDSIRFSNIRYLASNNFDGLGLDIMIPINIYEGQSRKTIAIVIIRIGLEKTLYPIIEQWPYASKSAESLLVRKDGDDVLFLTKLRFQDAEDLSYKVPLSEEHLPAALALKGFSGVLEGIDYRGIEVLAAAHKVAGTHWALITKIDANEVYKPLQEITNWVLYVAIAFITVLFACFLFWWQSLTTRIKSNEYKLQLDKQALESHFEYLSKFANDIILLTDDNRHIIEANDKAISTYQYTREELLGKLITELEGNDVRVTNQDKFKASINEGFIYEDHHRSKDGHVFPVEISLRMIEKEGDKYQQLIIRDITECKQKDNELRLSEIIVQSSNDMISIIDKEYRYLKINPAFARGVGKSEEEIVGHTISEIVGENTFQDMIKANIAESLNGKTIKKVEKFDLPDKEKESIDVEIRPYYDRDKNVAGAIIIFKNISEILNTQQRLLESDTRLKFVDKELLRSENQLRTVIEAASLGFWHLDIEKNKHMVNRIWLDNLGLSKDDIAENQNDFDERLHPDDKAYVFKFFSENMQSDETMTIEYRLRHKKGHYIWLEDRYAIVSRDTGTGKALHLSGVTKDITEHKNIQIELQNTYAALKALSVCNEVMVRAKSEDELTQKICDAIVAMEDYQSVWVGFIVDEEKNFIKPVALSGMENTSIIKNKNVEIKGTPFHKVINSCEHLIVEDLDKDKKFILTDDYNDKFKSLIKLPIKIRNNAVGCITIFKKHRHHFSNHEVSLLKEMADDIGYGINSLRESNENKSFSKKISDSLIKTIKAIAITVEKRDPYTAGHMNHVAKLSTCIAKEMGLSDETIQGIGLGAAIHDIGKIYIPAEILNRPGKLSKAEFEMIKSHSQVGYDIVKEIDFTWPIAKMISQHHEKLDGSGYPNGLKGDEIILEAQIIAVADVMEAISSHRPYRPSLGIEAGMDVIEEGRGTLFNAEAVDACVKIVKEGFQFDNQK